MKIKTTKILSIRRIHMSIWGSYENLAYEIFYWLAYTKICTNENYPLYGIIGQSACYESGQFPTVFITDTLPWELSTPLQCQTTHI